MIKKILALFALAVASFVFLSKDDKKSIAYATVKQIELKKNLIEAGVVIPADLAPVTSGTSGNLLEIRANNTFVKKVSEFLI